MPRTLSVAFFLCLAVTACSAFTNCTIPTFTSQTGVICNGIGGAVLLENQSLSQGSNRFVFGLSSGSAYFLSMQLDGNLVLYSYTATPPTIQPRYSSNTLDGGQGKTFATLQSDGNLVVYRTSAAGVTTAVAATGSNVGKPKGQSNATFLLSIQADGNMVIYILYADGTSEPVWSLNSTPRLVWACQKCAASPSPSPTPSSSVAPSPSPSPSPVLSQDIIDCLSAHNTIRNQLGLPSLTWDSSIANDAQLWFQNHQGFNHWIPSQSGEGQNLYASTGSPVSCKQAVASWGAESVNYHGEVIPQGSFELYGHYTQIVWKTTKTVGCAVGVTSDPFPYTVVCNYFPAGNIVGQTPF
ncbi:CAP domain-containing protein [Polychytrium aggregatum]|uniref:CAP domain-containing protein n=1 Tax=Polychytrium aggregatum TaxID=110093 RepID=UPI0022FE97A8|nr:CAP domain-containing protein [Polychytrium aggregatum]KAI9203479.1 CAP domain-containing protein [Polychytrium aggregatum]